MASRNRIEKRSWTLTRIWALAWLAKQADWSRAATARPEAVRAGLLSMDPKDSKVLPNVMATLARRGYAERRSQRYRIEFRITTKGLVALAEIRQAVG